MARPTALESLRKLLHGEVEDVADLPKPEEKQPEPQPEETITSQPTRQTATAAPLAHHYDSDDSDDPEAGCVMEMTQVVVEPRVAEAEDGSNADSSHASGFKGVLPLISAPAPAAGMVPGQLTPNGQSFCPILPVSKFPYKYIDETVREYVANSFFNAKKFWNCRKWEL